MLSKKLFFLLMPFLLVAEQSVWIPSIGIWQDSANWNNGVPGITSGVNNPNLDAIFDVSSAIVTLNDPVNVNKISFYESCTLSGSEIILGIGTKSFIVKINSGVNVIFNNPLIINSSGNISGSGTSSPLQSNNNITINSSIVTISNLNLIPLELSLNDSTLNMTKSTVAAGAPFTMTNSTANFSNSQVSFFTTLAGSNLNLTNNTNYSFGSISMDSSSFITIKDSTAIDKVPFGDVQFTNINFILTNTFSGPFLEGTFNNLDLSQFKGNVTLSGSLTAGPHTYTLLSDFFIPNFNSDNFTFPTNNQNITWAGPVMQGNNVILTAVAHSFVSASITNVMSTSSQTTLSTVKQLENVKQNARSGDQTYLVSNFSNHDSSYLAQNSVFAQATPVEQLSERGIYRPLHQWSVYVAPLGSVGSTKSKKNQPGSDFHSAGFFAGFDWVTSYIHDPERNFGFGIGSTFYYSRLHAEAAHHAEDLDIDHILVNIYGTLFSKKLEELSFNFAAGAGYNWQDMKRITGHFACETARAKTGGYEVSSFAGLEYLFSESRYPHLGNFRFMPMVYLQYTRVQIDGYREHGAGEFNMSVAIDDLDSLRSFLGARANYLVRANCNVTIRPEITIGWQREFLTDHQCATFNTIGLAIPQSVCSTIAPERNTLIIGADIFVKMYQWTSLEVNYQFTYNNLLIDHEFYLQWKVEF